MTQLHNSGPRLSLRAHLKAGTKAVHDELDASVARFALERPAGYARFLAAQYEAREPIEQWADRYCPALLRPPSMTGLLGEDLAEIAPARADLSNRPGPHPGLLCSLPPFALPAGADPIGLAWALAGSQMGNRAILARLRKAPAPASAAAVLPHRFLGDTRMTGFWYRLLPRLHETVSEARAVPALAAARAVFIRFEQAFARHVDLGRQAA